MASEFEKALVAINSMSYDEKMKYAKELRENHENIIGHHAESCAFCKPISEYASHVHVCDMCFKRMPHYYANIYGGFPCEECNNVFRVCGDCISLTHCPECGDYSSCNDSYCRTCLSSVLPKFLKVSEGCEECRRDNVYFNTMLYTHPKFTYDELMQLGEALKKDHKISKSHIVKDCIWCYGSNPNQKICSYCSWPLISNSVDEDGTEFNCYTCKEKFIVCDDCYAEFACDVCTKHYYKRYCKKCLISMPSDLYCDLHDVIIDNPFGHEGMTKACRP